MNAADTYNDFGPSEQCLNTLQQPCDANSVGDCAGDQSSNYVYRIILTEGQSNEQCKFKF